jgi:NADH-quinone oxidoreductase subunit M
MAILLTITVLLPLLASIALFASPQLDAQRARSLALGTALATLALTLVLLAGFKSTEVNPQFAFKTLDGRYGLRWIVRPDIRFALGLDGFSLWLFVLTAVLMITAIFASWESIKDRAAAYYAFLLALETGLLGLFASLDVVLFYIFFEFTLIPLFFLIGFWGGPKRRKASVTFFLYTLAGSLLTLLGVIALVIVHYQYSPDHKLTFSMWELTEGLSRLPWNSWRTAASWTSPQVLIFLLLFAGFAIKVPMFPFHTWLPLAHVEAPTAGSIILAGVLLKVGTYGLLRFNIAMTPLAAMSLYPLIATLAVIGIIYGALAALSQTDIKRLVAYSSVSHMGFIVLGLFALNSTGLAGGSIQMINHGLSTGALFACVGIIYERYHTREMKKLGGLWNRLPILALFLILAALASAAVPGLNGFVGEFPILVGTFGTSPRAAVLAATGMILGACYLLLMLRNVIFGPLREPALHAAVAVAAPAAPALEVVSIAPIAPSGDAAPAHVAAETSSGPNHGHESIPSEPHGHGGDHHGGNHDEIAPIGWHEVAGLSPVLALIVLIGIAPAPFLLPISTAVADLERTIRWHKVGAGQYVPPRTDLVPGTIAAQKGAGGATPKAGGQTKKGGGGIVRAQVKSATPKTAKSNTPSTPPAGKGTPATKGGSAQPQPANPPEKAPK